MTLGGGIGFGENVRRSERRAGERQQGFELEGRRITEAEKRGEFGRGGFEFTQDLERELMGMGEEGQRRKEGRALSGQKLKLDYANALAQGNQAKAQENALALIRERGRVQGLKDLQEATFDIITRGQGGAAGTSRGLGLPTKMTDVQRKRFELMMSEFRSAQSQAARFVGQDADSNARAEEKRQALEQFLRSIQGGQDQGLTGAPGGALPGLGAGTSNVPLPTAPGPQAPAGAPGAANPASLAGAIISMSQGDAGQMLKQLRGGGLQGISKQFAGFGPDVAGQALEQIRGTIGQPGGVTAAELAELQGLTDTARVAFEQGIQQGGYAQDPIAFGDAAFDAATARDTRVAPAIAGGAFAANTLLKDRLEKGQADAFGTVGPELATLMSQDGTPENGMAMFQFVLGLNEIFAGGAAPQLPGLEGNVGGDPFSGFVPPGGGGQADTMLGGAGQALGGQGFIAGPQPQGMLESAQLHNLITNAAADGRPEWNQVLSLAQELGVGSALLNEEQLLAKHKLGQPTPPPGNPNPLTADEDLGMRLHQQGIQAKLGLLQNMFADFEGQLQGGEGGR